MHIPTTVLLVSKAGTRGELLSMHRMATVLAVKMNPYLLFAQQMLHHSPKAYKGKKENHQPGGSLDFLGPSCHTKGEIREESGLRHKINNATNNSSPLKWKILNAYVDDNISNQNLSVSFFY